MAMHVMLREKSLTDGYHTQAYGGRSENRVSGVCIGYCWLHLMKYYKGVVSYRHN